MFVKDSKTSSTVDSALFLNAMGSHTPPRYGPPPLHTTASTVLLSTGVGGQWSLQCFLPRGRSLDKTVVSLAAHHIYQTEQNCGLINSKKKKRCLKKHPHPRRSLHMGRGGMSTRSLCSDNCCDCATAGVVSRCRSISVNDNAEH